MYFFFYVELCDLNTRYEVVVGGPTTTQGGQFPLQDFQFVSADAPSARGAPYLGVLFSSKLPSSHDISPAPPINVWSPGGAADISSVLSLQKLHSSASLEVLTELGYKDYPKKKKKWIT